MEIDLRGKHWTCFGKKKGGKTNFNKWLLSSRPRHFVFDPNREYDGFNRYCPNNRRGQAAKNEMGEVFLDQVVYPNQDKINYVKVDEVNRYTKSKGELDGAVGELVDLNRHKGTGKGMGVGFTARRPQQVHNDIQELSDYIFIFPVAGVSTEKYTADMHRDVLAALKQLEPYQCVMIDSTGTQRDIYILDRVDNMDGKIVDVDVYDFA